MSLEWAFGSPLAIVSSVFGFLSVISPSSITARCCCSARGRFAAPQFSHLGEPLGDPPGATPCPSVALSPATPALACLKSSDGLSPLISRADRRRRERKTPFQGVPADLVQVGPSRCLLPCFEDKCTLFTSSWRRVSGAHVIVCFWNRLFHNNGTLNDRRNDDVNRVLLCNLRHMYMMGTLYWP